MIPLGAIRNEVMNKKSTDIIHTLSSLSKGIVPLRCNKTESYVIIINILLNTVIFISFQLRVGHLRSRIDHH